MQDATPSGHPLHIAGRHLAFVAKAVAVFDGAGEDIGDRLNAAVRMPRKSRQIICWILIAKIVQQKKGIEFFRLAKTEGALQLHARALDGRHRLNDLFNRSE